jgi:hypothetical protein
VYRILPFSVSTFSGKAHTPTHTPTNTPTETPTPTPVLGIHLSGYASAADDGGPLKDVIIYVYFEATDELREVARTDGSGYYYKIWVPYEKESKVTVFASFNEHSTLPEGTEFDPMHTWFHRQGEENLVLDFKK